jgi:RNA polymerase sigma-70 factor (ECF subfamily)
MIRSWMLRRTACLPARNVQARLAWGAADRTPSGGTMDQADSQLLQRIAAADPEAFAEFYDRHAAAVFGLLTRLLPQRGDAEDVLQETFCQVWRQANRYDGARACPRGWLLMLARSRALDHLRRQRPAGDIAGVGEPFQVTDATQPAQRNEAAELIRAALSQLPEEQRSALSLAFYDGLSYRQVADRQAVQLGTAKTRIRLALARLRSLLNALHDEVSTS